MMNVKLLVLLKSVDGGTGTYLEGLLRLKDLYPSNKLEIKVLVLEKPRFRKVNVSKYIYCHGDNISQQQKYKLDIKNIINIFTELLWLNDHTKRFRPNIIISSDSHSTILSEITRIFFFKRYKTIAFIQNNLSKVIEYRINKYLRPFVRLALSFVLNMANVVVSVSEDLSKALFLEYKLKKVPVSIQAILPSRFEPLTLAPTNVSSSNIVSVARLDFQKDHRTLLCAFQIVSKRFPSARLLLVGDGPLSKDLRVLVKNLGLTKKVKFIGWVQNPIKILRRSSIFVLSSFWEGFSLTLIEAMKIGLPVVATNCKYGPREIMGKNKYGLLSPVGDVYALADNMIKLLENKNMRTHYSAMSIKRAKDYDSSIMLKKYKKIIDHLTSIIVG